MKLLKMFCRTLGLATIILVAGIYAVLTLPRVFGYDTYSIVSGSMEPEIPVGSMVFAHRGDPALLVKGDVVVFSDGTGSAVTHRVCENRVSDRALITRGDANPTEDPGTVPYLLYLGTVRRTVPRLGDLSIIMASTPAKLGSVGMLLAGAVLVAISRREDEEEEE